MRLPAATAAPSSNHKSARWAFSRVTTQAKTSLAQTALKRPLPIGAVAEFPVVEPHGGPFVFQRPGERANPGLVLGGVGNEDFRFAHLPARFLSSAKYPSTSLSSSKFRFLRKTGTPCLDWNSAGVIP